MPLRHDKNETVLRARALRRNMTLPEGLLWRVLRTRPAGFKFRRQHPVGPYIADFYCPAEKLIIEVDGASHLMRDRPHHDAIRDRRISDQSMRVIRFAATDVLNDLESVVMAIELACRR